MINNQIKDEQVRLISASGEQLGIVKLDDAMQLADDEGLDLVKIASNSVPPVCKIMDYGKYRFEQGKKEKENRKSQKIVSLRVIELTYCIQDRDLEIKLKKAIEFLTKGEKVKITVPTKKSRRPVPVNLCFGVVKKFVEKITVEYVVEKPAEVGGRFINMVIAPKKK